MKNNKNYKFTNELKRVGPRLKWLLFSEMQTPGLKSDYIDLLCQDGEQDRGASPIDSLRRAVENSLVHEFSPDVKNLKSFDMLVDAVMYNIQKKALAEDDESLLQD